MRKDHDIFNTPNQVDLTMEERAPSTTYLYRSSGRELGETMPMWRVQTEGYKDGKGMLIGLVCSPTLAHSADGEFISSGLNSKGCDAVAIGRQGNFLHWGFAASPTYMTDESKLVFVNSIHYISKFAGQKAFVKKIRFITTRQAVDEMMYNLTDEGYEATKAYFASASRPAPGRKWAIRHGIPDSIKKKFGDDWQKYIDYYEENRPYLHYVVPEGERIGKIFVDEDARSLEIANDDVRLLDRCVELLDSDDRDELAMRLLSRYTNESFDTADDWKKWLADHRGHLVFSEVSGFKFLVDPNKAGVQPQSKNLQDSADAVEIEVDEPDFDDPVKLNCELVPVESDSGNQFQVVLKAKILDGWHIYSTVPAGEPYTVTSLQIETSDGVEKAGDLRKPEALPSIGNPAIKVWEGEISFSQGIRLTDKSADKPTVRLVIRYQACDENMCQIPKKKTFELDVK